MRKSVIMARTARRRSASTARARRLCPTGVFLAPRFERYAELSERVFGIYRRYTPLVDPLSLDEAFLDVTESRALHGSGRDIAVAVKREVRRETGLTVSAGVAEVKMAAKIASDLGKPDTVHFDGGNCFIRVHVNRQSVRICRSVKGICCFAQMDLIFLDRIVQLVCFHDG